MPVFKKYPVDDLMEKKIGVCMLTGAFYPEISGGGIQAFKLASALKELIDYYVITTTRDLNLAKEEEINKIKIFRVLVNPENTFSKIYAFLVFLRKFLKIRQRINIIHLHGFSQKTLVFVILGKIFRKKIIQKITLVGEDDPLSIVSSKFGKFKLLFFSMADIYISISPAITNIFRKSKLLDSKLYEIPNGVDCNKFKPIDNVLEKKLIRKELGLPENKKIVMFVGSFSSRKGIDFLINTWKKIRDKNKEYSNILFICSMNADNIKNDFIFFTNISKDFEYFKIKKEFIFIEKTLEIEKYFLCSDIFVLPSKAEGLPNALLEAMASGLACLATCLDGITNYIIEDNKNGLLFEQDNIDDFSEKLISLLYDQYLLNKLGTCARETILERFDMGIIANKYLKIYKDLQLRQLKEKVLN